MRVTNQLMLARSLESLAQGLDDVARLQRQVSTGLRFQALSEAPLDGRSVLEIDADLRSSEQFTRNIEAVRTRLATEDASLQSLNGILTRAREIAIQQGGSVANSATRLAAQREVQALRDSVIQLANQRTNDAYTFGGDHADLAPLDAAGALDPLRPARGAPSYEIGPGVFAPGAHDAGQIFVDSDVIGALDALDVALGTNSLPGIQASGDRLRTVLLGVQDLVAEVGARQARLDLAQDSQTIVTEALSTRRSNLVDAPIEEAVTRLAARQSAYQASLLATARFLDTTLVNYLR